MDIASDERLTCFIFSSRYFACGKGVVKFGEFVQPPARESLSVYRISSLPDEKVWKLGREYVETDERRLKAKADLLVSDVYKNDLKVVPGTQPHKLHANITPFPADRTTRQRLAAKLASASKLVIIPPEDP